jgi:recombinational DNA repair protein (RecF pathway)
MLVDESVSYLSPQRTLLRFFHRSRDKWKAKCKEAKRENKSLKYRLGVMTEARNRWKAETRRLQKNAKAETTIAAEETTKNDAHHGARRC